MRRVGKTAAVLAIAALLISAVRVPVDTLLREPLTRLWWLVDSLPQQLIWWVLAIAGFVAVLSYTRGLQQSKQEASAKPMVRETQLDRLTALIRLADTSPWARDVLGRRLCQTAAGLRALREGIHLDDARQQLRAGRWPNQQRFAAVLQPHREEEWTLSDSYADDLRHTLDAMERYGHGGPFEAS